MSRPFDPRSKILSLLCASALLFACSGDTGPTGPPGATGSTGSTGSPGSTGGTVSALVPIQSVEKINVSFDSVTIGAAGQAPELVMRLTDDFGFGITGLPVASVGFTLAQLSPGQNGGSSAWQSYVTRSSAGIENAQATTESAGAGSFTANGDGTYTLCLRTEPARLCRRSHVRRQQDSPSRCRNTHRSRRFPAREYSGQQCTV